MPNTYFVTQNMYIYNLLFYFIYEYAIEKLKIYYTLTLHKLWNIYFLVIMSIIYAYCKIH